MVAKKKTSAEAGVASVVTPDPNDSIAAELRNARDATGLSFSELHRLTGISRTTLHDYESGRSKPGAREIRLLCNALRISPNRLLYSVEEPFKEKSRLHTLLGVGNETLRTARLAMILSLLSRDVVDAWITILGESLKSRAGRGENLDLALDAIEAATEGMAAGLDDVINQAFPAEKLAQIGAKVEKRVKARVKAK